MKTTILTAALFVAAAITAGCGGSGSMSDSSAAKSTISGAVADGYLVGAQVFQDINRNYILDAGEPNTTTDAKGEYVLTVDQNDSQKHPIIALAIAGVTTDLDNPTQKIANSYVLSMHAVSVTPSAAGTVTGTVNNFISPISTQLREMMETGTYTKVEDAVTELRSKLGMPPTSNIMGNYIANQNSNMQLAARNMATLMGGQAGQVMPGNKVDINRYRSMMGSLFGNISTVRAANPANPTQSAVMTQLRDQMRDRVLTVPAMVQGQPFRNFSAAYRPSMGGGMMGGR